ncbi:gliding motility-associated C-terminal domain-containing protein [Larkinella sp. GY13]|uniref:gliding motility-associated C-terminal domain-containing protein n=1 Tax=Larkinella sp. GY13 TaxID=3453720 RepID=UPI003EED6A17
MRAVRKWSAGLVGVVRHQVRFFLLGACFVLSLHTFAQTIDWCVTPPTNAGKGSFNVSAKKGCAPMTVTVSNTTGIPDNIFLYVYDYKGGDPVATKSGVAATTYTFTKPGKYKILQLGSVGTGSVACQEIEVLDATPPNFRAFTCSDRRVLVDIVNDAVASQYDEFIIDWGDGSPRQTVQKTAISGLIHTYSSQATRTINVQGNYRDISCGGMTQQSVTPGGTIMQPTVSSLKTTGTTVALQIQVAANQVVVIQKKNASGTFENTTTTRTGSGSVSITNVTSHPTCFKVVSQDGCGNTVASDEVCSIGLEVEAKDQQNAVVWTVPGSPANFQKYTVSKNDDVFRTFTSVGTSSVTDSEGLNCNEEYCYQVTALVGTTEIISDRKCVTVRSSAIPPAFSTVQVSVNGDNRVDLRGLPPVPTSQSPSYKMIVFRRDNPGGSFVQTGEEVDRNIHQDGGVQPQQQSYCYQLVYQNACGVSSEPSKMVCTIFLNSHSASTIDWTSDSPFADEAIDRYVIEKIDDSGVVWEEVAVGLQTSYRPANEPDSQRFRFRVKAVSKSGSISYSNFYTFVQASRVFVPDAFTPNDDGVNDLLEVKGSTYLASIQLTVYNRWGEVVFRSESREGWDGKISGQAAPAGTYAYRVSTTDQNGLKTEKTGQVLLIR